MHDSAMAWEGGTPVTTVMVECGQPAQVASWEPTWHINADRASAVAPSRTFPPPPSQEHVHLVQNRFKQQEKAHPKAIKRGQAILQTPHARGAHTYTHARSHTRARAYTHARAHTSLPYGIQSLRPGNTSASLDILASGSCSGRQTQPTNFMHSSRPSLLACCSLKIINTINTTIEKILIATPTRPPPCCNNNLEANGRVRSTGAACPSRADSYFGRRVWRDLPRQLEQGCEVQGTQQVVSCQARHLSRGRYLKALRNGHVVDCASDVAGCQRTRHLSAPALTLTEFRMKYQAAAFLLTNKPLLLLRESERGLRVCEKELIASLWTAWTGSLH